MGNEDKREIGRHIEIEGVRVPTFLYGTAWKEEKTRDLVWEALKAGFSGIDTANQRRHYFEAAVGEAVKAAIAEGIISRDALFLQTKFTFVEGQDNRLPYDPEADTATQVAQSFASSLEHLGTDYVDSYVLHGPSTAQGLGERDWDAWRAMENLKEDGKVKLLGVSNVNRGQLEELCRDAKIPPAMVQNRCYARLGWDEGVRTFCREKGIRYQGFSLLTANRAELTLPAFEKIVESTGKNAAQVVFRFAMQIGMLPLTGTTDPAHMRSDLDVYDYALSDEHCDVIQGLGRGAA